jgi:CubicO group peptidase (beta-lactamase class C family)
VGFGLLGYLVEVISGSDFSEYCRSEIFSALGMDGTAWYLRDLDVTRHAVPYTYATEAMIENLQENPVEGLKEALPRNENIELKDIKADSFFAHCHYSFPNYPDGLVRTSVNELGLFLSAYINAGSYGTGRILQPETVRTMLSNDHFERGLCWYRNRLRDGREIWGHGGGDPGISTRMFFSPEDSVGAIVFANTGTGALGSILGLLFEEEMRQ